MRSGYDANTVNWKSIFLHQTGAGDIARFRGLVSQRGAGLGAIVKTLLHLAPIFLKSPIGQQLVGVAKNVSKDVMAGEKIQGSMKKHARAAVKNMTGIGKKKKKKKMIGYIDNKPHFLK